MSKQHYFPVRLNPEDPYEVTLYPVSEEEYYALYRPVWRMQKEMRKKGQCRCPSKKLWICDGECDLCCYWIPEHHLSYDGFTAKYGDRLTAPDADPAEIAADREILRRLLKRLGELCPEALDVGDLMTDGDGMSQREALKQLGLKRSTYRSQVDKAERLLRQEFADDNIEKLM